MDITNIRKVFPDWPSELDMAKMASNWAMQAQAYFCAAQVLNEESKSTNQRFHSNVEKPIDEKDLIRQQTTLPAEFCLAFALELVIKAVLVHQGKLEELASGEALPFNHKLLDQALKINDLEITDKERETLLWASDAVISGKYPVSKKPSDNKNGVPVARSLSDRINEVQPTYKKLMDIITNNNTNK